MNLAASGPDDRTLVHTPQPQGLCTRVAFSCLLSVKSDCRSILVSLCDLHTHSSTDTSRLSLDTMHRQVFCNTSDIQLYADDSVQATAAREKNRTIKENSTYINTHDEHPPVRSTSPAADGVCEEVVHDFLEVLSLRHSDVYRWVKSSIAAPPMPAKQQDGTQTLTLRYLFPKHIGAYSERPDSRAHEDVKIYKAIASGQLSNTETNELVTPNAILGKPIGHSRRVLCFQLISETEESAMAALIYDTTIPECLVTLFRRNPHMFWRR